MHWVAPKDTHELRHFLQMSECILGHIIRQVAHKVHMEEISEASSSRCSTTMRKPQDLSIFQHIWVSRDGSVG